MTVPSHPVLIESDRDMGRFALAVESADIVGVDTESDSFYAYREKVCLIQVSTRDQDILVDPLGVEDLTVFRNLLEDPGVTKVFHAAENDVILLRHHLDIGVRGVFDTLIAAQVLGIEQCSLAGLLHRFFGLELSKKEQRSDWRRRPLTESQIQYAALDTHHLLALREQLLERLVELGRVDEAESDFRLLENKQWEPRPFRADDFARIKGAKDLDPLGVRILRELFVLRNRLAQESDTAPFRIMGDATLMHLARRRPTRPHDLQDIRSFPRRGRPLAGAVLETIRAARELGPLRLPPPPDRGNARPRLTPEESRLFDGLRKWRDAQALERGVMPHRVLKNDLLLAFVRAAPRNMEDVSRIEALDAWRAETYGPAVLLEMERLHSG